MLKVVRHPPTFKISRFKILHCYINLPTCLFCTKMSKGAAKIIHNKTFKETIVQLLSNCSLVSLCSSPGFCPAQQSLLLAVSGQLSTFKMQELGYFDPYQQVPSLYYLYLEILLAMVT